MKTFLKISIRYFIFFGAIFLFSFLNASPCHAWLADYGYRKEITVQANNINSDLTDFPLYVFINNDTDIGEKMQNTTDYYDLRFTDSNDNILPYEEENMNIADGSATGNYWVKKSLDDITGSTIYLYYSKSGDTEGSDTSGVWNSNYKGVWHLNEGDSTDASFYEDSTSNNNDGQLIDADGDTTQVDGKTGKAINFNGDTDNINLGSDSSLAITNNMTVEAWVKADTLEAETIITARSSADGQTNNWRFLGEVYGDGSGGNWGFRVDPGFTAESPADTELSTETWYHLSSTYNQTTVRLYRDGETDGTSAQTFALGTSQPIRIAQGVGGAMAYFDGIIDEVRISNTVRSADWIKFSYANMGGQVDNELTWNSEEEDISLIVNSLLPTNNANDIAIESNLVITFNENVDAESGYITLYNSDNTLIETFDVTTDISGSGTDTITINPSSDLEGSTVYYVQIDTTAFDNSSNNSYIGINNETTWSFTTVAVGRRYVPSSPNPSNTESSQNQENNQEDEKNILPNNDKANNQEFDDNNSSDNNQEGVRLVKLSGNPTVYQINTDGSRQPFIDAETYFTYYKDFSVIEEISLAELSNYPLGSPVTYNKGTLIKFTTIPKVFLVIENNVLRWIINEEIFFNLGYTFNTVINTFDSFWSLYTVGENIIGIE